MFMSFGNAKPWGFKDIMTWWDGWDCCLERVWEDVIGGLWCLEGYEYGWGLFILGVFYREYFFVYKNILINMGLFVNWDKGKV